jgi:hypothetical protein
MRWMDILLDNPILTKHVRSRLRPMQALPWAVIVFVLSACVAWAGAYMSWIGESGAVTILLGLQVITLVFGGSNQINASLGQARESGILDFHRVSPVPPAVVALGFFLGAPIREYILAAIALPFGVFCAYGVDAFNHWKGISWFAQIELAVLMTTWIFHALTVIGCLTRKKPRSSVRGVVIGVILVVFLGYAGSVGFYFGTQWLLEETRYLNFFGRLIPWLAWLVIYEVPALVFLGLAISRKMKADRTHAYTKRQALACMATLTALGLAGLWNIGRLMPPWGPFDPTGADIIMVASVYVLSIAAMILVATITPDAGEYVKGVRRASHLGRRRPSPWSDAGSNRIALFAICAMLLAGTTAIVYVVGRPSASGGPNPTDFAAIPNFVDHSKMADEAWLRSRQAFLSRPIVVGVLTVAYVGLALQYFSLRSRKSGLVLLTLFLFVAWLVPMLGGAIIGMSGPNQERALAILSLSPLPGLALSSGLGKPPGSDTIQMFAMAPPITFAFIFNYLLVITQRKIDRQLREKEKPTPAETPVDPWDVKS